MLSETFTFKGLSQTSFHAYVSNPVGGVTTISQLRTSDKAGGFLTEQFFQPLLFLEILIINYD